MDPRVERHAEIIVDHSIDSKQGDEVILMVPHAANDLAVALSKSLGRRGANVTHLNEKLQCYRAHLRAIDPAELSRPSVTIEAMKACDAIVRVRGTPNVHELGDVDPETRAENQKVTSEITDVYTQKRWVGTQYPTSARAQKAEMSTSEYEEFVWGAINRDWEAQYEYQQQLVELLDPADHVRVVSGETTDVTLDVSGMDACNDYGKNNLPGGEVFTAPNPRSVDGEVLFDFPVITGGCEIEGAHLVFEDGEVVDHSAESHEDVLSETLNTDDGARRVGELGVGMNRDIDRFTGNMLLDEKMWGTIHLAVGRATDDCVPAEKAANDSAIHLDMLIDMNEDSFLEVDGEVVQRNGTFRFDDEFEE